MEALESMYEGNFDVSSDSDNGEQPDKVRIDTGSINQINVINIIFFFLNI